MDGKEEKINNIKYNKTRKEFLAGFMAGLVCFGSIAFVLLLIFSL